MLFGRNNYVKLQTSSTCTRFRHPSSFIIPPLATLCSAVPDSAGDLRELHRGRVASLTGRISPPMMTDNLVRSFNMSSDTAALCALYEMASSEKQADDKRHVQRAKTPGSQWRTDGRLGFDGSLADLCTCYMRFSGDLHRQ